MVERCENGGHSVLAVPRGWGGGLRACLGVTIGG